jgi:hypothetical protein
MYEKSKGKSQKAKGKSLFGRLCHVFQKQKKKISAALLPFEICLLPFDFL